MKARIGLLMLVCSINSTMALDAINAGQEARGITDQKAFSTNTVPLDGHKAINDRRQKEKKDHEPNDHKPLGLVTPSQATPDDGLTPLPSVSSELPQEVSQPGRGNLHTSVRDQSLAILPRVVGDSDLGFHLSSDSIAASSNSQFFELLHDETRLMVGEDVYAKMAWTYFEVKEVDNWIYSTTSQFSLVEYQSFVPYSLLYNLDDHLQAGLVLGAEDQKQWLNQNHSASIGLGGESAQALLSNSPKEFASDDGHKDSWFFTLLTNLTVKNLLYAMLSGLALIFLAKGFDFLIRLNGVRNGAK